MQSRSRFPGDPRQGQVGLGGPPGHAGPFVRSHGTVNDAAAGFGHAGNLPVQSFPVPNKYEIKMMAGRLAAEYLATKGKLSPDVLQRSWPNGTMQEFRSTAGEGSPPFVDNRVSALARLGNYVPDDDMGRRRLEEYDYPRRNVRGKRRFGVYDNRRGYSDWGRERRRYRGYSEHMQDEDDGAPGYQRAWRGANDEAGSSVSGAAGEGMPSKFEGSGETGSELDDAGSKASSSSIRKDAPPEADGGIASEKVEEINKVTNTESGEIKPIENVETKKNETPDDPKGAQADASVVDSARSLGNILLRHCSFAKVPKKPRSSLADRTTEADQKETVLACKMDAVANAHPGAIHMIVDETRPDKCVNGSQTDADGLDSQENLVAANVESELAQTTETCSSNAAIGGKSGEYSAIGDDKVEKSLATSAPSPRNNFLRSDSKKASLDQVVVPQQKDEMVEPLKTGSTALDNPFPTARDESVADLKDVNCNQRVNHHVPFKICDLNLTGSPEVTEIPDDQDIVVGAATRPVETKKKLPIDAAQSTVGNEHGAFQYNKLPGRDEVDLIHIDDDSPIVQNLQDTSEHKTSIEYPMLENMLNHPEHTDVLQGMQDGYNLTISDYLGSDIYPPMQGDLQGGIGLHVSEGIAGVDDPIYGSLGDIGFMEVWDQPNQDYEKFF